MEDLAETLRSECARVALEASAESVGILDGRGRLIVESGDDEYFAVSTQLDIIHSNIAAYGGLDDLLEVGEHSHVEVYGDRPSVFLAAVSNRLIVVVVYENSGALEPVRLAARAAASRIALLLTPPASDSIN